MWHGIDKYTEEIARFSRAAHGRDILRRAFEEKWPMEDKANLLLSLDAQKDMGAVVCLRKHLPNEVQPRMPIRLLMRSFPTYMLRVADGGQAWLNSMGIAVELTAKLEEINDPPRRH